MAIDPSINYIIGIDPGETSGFAIMHRESDNQWAPYRVEDVKKKDIWKYLGKIFSSFPYGIFIAEQFITNPKAFDKTFQKHFTIRVLGAIEYACYMSEIELHLQMPGDKYPACGRMFGQPYKRKPQHHYDALLHAGWFLLKNKETIKGLNG